MTVREFSDLLTSVGDPDSEVCFHVKGVKRFKEYVERQTAGTFDIYVDIDDDANVDDVSSRYANTVEVTLWVQE